MASDAPIALGEWHPPGSSHSVVAGLKADDDGLAVTAGDVVLSSGETNRVEISPRVGSIPRRLTFPDGSVFETGDNDGIDAWLRRHKGARAGLIHGLEAFRPRLIVFTLAVVLLTVAIFRYAVPVLVEVAVWVTPPMVPEMIGSGALSSLDSTLLEPSKLPDDRKATISQEFQKLAAVSQGGAGAYRLEFRDGGPIGPNAFALPNGSLIVTDDLIKLAEGDNVMVLGVLGHEIGHVEHQHTLRQIYRMAGVTALILLVAGDVGSSVQDILTQGSAILSLSYSRAAEAEADRRSVELMRAAGYDPTALARFFTRLEATTGNDSDTSMLSTHPGTPERQRAVIDYANQLANRAGK
ncbi:M48 family metallopeptidase [Pleomorphomonas sp. PLEO]|uniref:M48 family metallopeptidase n=1 Tax=Pleomorphomonas sp. PLEO TaxID=3239306 RepID=UPI00351E1B38